MLPVRIEPPQIDVVCAGSPAEQGAEQGRVLRDRILACSRALHDLEALHLQRPWWLPYKGFLWLADRRALRALRGALRSELTPHWKRLEAMSRSSGLSLPRLALLNALEPVLSDLTRSVASGVETACSAIAVGQERSATGGAIVAHNFDYLPLVQPFYVLRDERPHDGLRSLQFSIAPLCGAVDGLNEAGLAVTYNYAYATDRAAPAPTLSMRLAEVLAKCRTVPEGVSDLMQTTRWGSGLIMLADAEGRTASVQLTNTHCAVREGSPGEILSHSNRFSDPQMSRVQISLEAVHGPNAPAALRGRRVHQSAERRDERLAACLAGGEVLSIADVARHMADHGPDGVPSADSICMHSPYWHTTACLQLLPAERLIRVAYAPACVARYVEFSL